MKASLLLDTKHALGEGASWCERSGCFYWTDIEGQRLWRHAPHSRRTDHWMLPERLASFALCEDDRHVLLGLASHLAFLDVVTGDTETIVAVEAGLNTRLNDGRCDRAGRFVFGTKDEDAPPQRIGGFYRLNADLSLERLPLPAPAVANGIAFSPDGSLMYYCDSPAREIRVCDYGKGRGGSSEPVAHDRVFTRLSDPDGEPDGATVDAEGGLWSAQWGGARVVRYGPDGQETQRIAVPTAQPSCVAFGGPRLRTLYITSARIGLDAAALAADPHAGGVFIATPAQHGLPEPRFAGRARGTARLPQRLTRNGLD